MYVHEQAYPKKDSQGELSQYLTQVDCGQCGTGQEWAEYRHQSGLVKMVMGQLAMVKKAMSVRARSKNFEMKGLKWKRSQMEHREKDLT